MSARPWQVSWWLTDRRTGAYVIGQRPNLPSKVMTVLSVLARLPLPPHVRRTARVIGALAMGWWAWLEITQGVNPFRRLLGVIGAVTAVRSLAEVVREPMAETEPARA